jgi:type I restriction enzyme S subunit
MRTYKEYIDSGIVWIGLVPSSWRQTQLKYISSISKGKKAKEDFQDFKEGMIPYLSMEYLRSQTESPSFVFAEDPNIVLVEKQDLLILWDGSKAGEIVKAKIGALSSTMGKIHVDSDLFDLNYLTYYLKNAERYIQANTVGMGIPHVSGEVLRTLYITFPNKEEQSKIAQYLDNQTTIIDQLILQKEKLIELLKEKRQAVINEAVTKGLNPNAKMKDSGIAWLGSIPQAWNLVQIRHLNTKVGSGVTPKGGAEVYTEKGVIFIRSQNVHFDGLHLDDVVRIDLDTHKKMSGSKVQFKDVLLNITGASIGRCCVVDINEEMNVNQHVCIIRPTQRILSEYLNLVLQSNIGQVQIKLGTTGGNREGLTFEAIKEFTIPLPGIDEQHVILDEVLSSLKRYYELENFNTIQIDKLKEYRQSIISEAVTGKIDVRDWKPNKNQVS